MTEHEQYKLCWGGITAGLRVGYAGGVILGAIMGAHLPIVAIALGWFIGLAILNLLTAWVEAKL